MYQPLAYLRHKRVHLFHIALKVSAEGLGEADVAVDGLPGEFEQHVLVHAHLGLLLLQAFRHVVSLVM